MFVAREKELETLSSLLHRKSSSFAVVYGRRRIGKTETIRHFIKKHSLAGIEITGVYGATKATQIKSFVRKIERGSQNQVVAQGKIKEWQDVFFLLQDYIETLSYDKKVVFLDELPWLDTHRSGFISAFSEFWNDFCTRRSDVILIVCGSATSYMMNKIVKNKKTLHNRVTHKLSMYPFKLPATKMLLQANNCSYTNKSIVDTYIALGGVAKYLSDMDNTKHQTENINYHCFDMNGLLVNEYQEIYESLFKNYQWHYRVMNLLSTKWSGYTQKEIAERLKSSASYVKIILEELELSGFITSSTCLGMMKRNKIFRATDPFSFFYNKWMKNNQGINWAAIAVSQQYKTWSGFAFENICHIHTDEIKSALGISGVNTQTHYWSCKQSELNDKGAQIDMLLEYTDGSRNIDIIECKYCDDKFTITKKYYHELREKIDIFNRQTKSKYNIRLIFLTMSGVLRNEYYHDIVDKEVTIDTIMS